MVEALVEARVMLGSKQLGLGFVCDPADKRAWSHRAEALRGSLELAMLPLRGAIVGAPAIEDNRYFEEGY